jgi:glutamate racemase
MLVLCIATKVFFILGLIFMKILYYHDTRQSHTALRSFIANIVSDIVFSHTPALLIACNHITNISLHANSTRYNWQYYYEKV